MADFSFFCGMLANYFKKKTVAYLAIQRTHWLQPKVKKQNQIIEFLVLFLMEIY